MQGRTLTSLTSWISDRAQLCLPPGGGWYVDSMATKRLLIGAASAESELTELPPDIRLLIDEAEEILVMSPRLPTKLEWLASDTDKTREHADARLEKLMTQLQEGTDSEVKGTLGADDPVLAFDDAVALFSPDHILLVLRSEENADWQESGLTDELITRFDLPVTSITLD